MGAGQLPSATPKLLPPTTVSVKGRSSSVPERPQASTRLRDHTVLHYAVLLHGCTAPLCNSEQPWPSHRANGLGHTRLTALHTCVRGGPVGWLLFLELE